MKTYEVVRFYRDENKRQRIIKRGLSKEDAQYHCGLESTHNLEEGWFDGWREE